MKKIGFQAQVKKIEHISLVSGDKMTRLTLQFDSAGQTKTLNALNEIHDAEKMVAVAIAEMK